MPPLYSCMPPCLSNPLRLMQSPSRRSENPSRLIVPRHPKDYFPRPVVTHTIAVSAHTTYTQTIAHAPNGPRPCTRASHRTRSLRFLRSRSRFSLPLDTIRAFPTRTPLLRMHPIASLRRIHARARRTSGLERTLLALVLSPSLISSPLLLSVCG